WANMCRVGCTCCCLKLCPKLGWLYLYIAKPQQDDLRLSSPSSGQGTDGGARTSDKRVCADLRAMAVGEIK
ncbi:hypothetical protein PoB_004658700, partial [Plakobranchus ocellatus]